MHAARVRSTNPMATAVLLGLRRFAVARSEHSRVLREALPETNGEESGTVHGCVSQVSDVLTSTDDDDDDDGCHSSRASLIDRLDKLT